MTERPSSRGLRDDSGAMLVVALIVITTVAVVTGAVLTHGWTNFRATATLRGVAGTAYAADTAAKVALNDLRLGADAPGWVTPTFPGLWSDWVYTNNADGTGCFGAVGTAPDNSLELAGLYPRTGTQGTDSSARVECSVVPGTGIFGAGSGVVIDDPDPTNAFARALTTIGTSGAWQGMTLKPLGTGNAAPMPVRGGVASKSFIDVDNGALVTDGYVKAEGNCIGQIVSVPAKACNQPGTVPVPTTPASPLTAVPAYRDPADYAVTCAFQPGFYNNAAALSDAVNGCATARFASGAYYFDFVDEEHGGENEWEIDTTVIGGQPSSGTTIPGRCLSPILNDPVAGVQFVFGGTSRVTLTDGAHVELCGPSNGGEAPMTVYQQTTGATQPSVPLSGQAAGTVVEKSGNGGGFKWTTSVRTPVGTTPRDAIAAADASSLAFTIAGTNDDVGLDLQNVAGLTAIPAGADIDSAQLRVRYAKTSARSLTVTVKDQTPADVPVGAPDLSGWGTADIAAQLRTALQDGAFTTTSPTLELRLLNAAKDDTLVIDAVQLVVTYTPPSLRAAVDVVLVGLAAGSNFAGEFVVQGATWAPRGYVALDPGSDNQALVAFRWGLVALGVDFKSQPSQEFGYPLVSLPDPGTGVGNKKTAVDLLVFVCVEQATCATGGVHALTVRAMITDPPYTTWGGGPPRPEPGRRRVEVLGWAEQR